MDYDNYDDSDDSEWISPETTDIPPHSSERYHPAPNTNHRVNPQTESFVGLIFGILAGIWDAIIRIRNVIVYIILFFVSVFIWPIGVFLLVCLLVWIFRG